MFQVGDQVFCPMRGSGVVEAREERVMLNEKREYFIIQMQSSDMTFMVPTDRVILSGFRLISDEATADAVLSTFASKEVTMDQTTPLKQRVKQNQAKMSSGLLMDCGEVVRDLTCIKKNKSLNASESSMLMEARRLLLEEISMIKCISKQQASELIDKLLA